MSKISKIYTSNDLLFRVGSRKGKTRKQLERMIDRQKFKKRKPHPMSLKRSKRSITKVNLDKETITLSEACHLLKVRTNRLRELNKLGLIEFVISKDRGYKVVTESVLALLNEYGNMKGEFEL
jgi:hypothetical protein